MEADINASDLALANAVAEETNAAMDNALETVRRLASYPEVVAADDARMAATFRTLMNARTDLNLTYRLAADGTMLFHFPTGPASTVGQDFSFRDYYQTALSIRQPFVSKGRISPTTNQPVATAVMPIWQGDAFVGLVATNMRLESLSHALAAIVAGSQSENGLELLIVDASGQIIAHSDAALLLSDAWLQAPQATAAVLDQQAGNVLGQSESGVERLYSYVPIREVGWGVVVSRPASVAFASPTLFRRFALLSILGFMIGGLFFWLILSRSVLRPVVSLAQFSSNVGLAVPRLEEADRAAIDTLARRTDQFGVLSRSMLRMQSNIQARLRELSTLLRTSAAVASSLDSATVLDRILEQVENLLDARMSAIFSLDEDRQLFRVVASRHLPDWYAEQAVIQPDEPASVTLQAIHSAHAVQVSDTEATAPFAGRSRSRRAGYRAVVAVPLPTQHVPPAVLLVFHPEPRVFTEREINLLTNFANHAAMAIENAALYARSDMRLQEQTRRLEALVQSMQDGLILEDLDGRVLYANRRIEELSGLLLHEIADSAVRTLMDRILVAAEAPEKVLSAIANGQHGLGPARIDVTLATQPRRTHLRIKLFEVTDMRGTPLGRGRILQDITQRFEIDRMKSSLISTVSHELRTPLSAIKGYASTLLADDVAWDPESQREFLGIISVEADRLNALVTDLLDMSRIEAGQLTVTRTMCRLPDLVHNAVQQALPPPGDRLSIALPHELPPLAVDERRIEAVMRNLLENALKYSGEATPITLSAAMGVDEIIVYVTDRGPGIPEADRERIFNSFYQVDGTLARKKAGAGLGLAISRGFVEAHGGRIWVEPVSDGFCVAFALPLASELMLERT